MSIVHVVHAMRMQLPHEEEDEGDEAFTHVTKEYFEFERKVARRQYTGKIVQELETARCMSVPRSFLRYHGGLQEALSCSYFTRTLYTLPDTLAITFERGYYHETAKEWRVDPSTFRCPLALQFPELGGTKHYALVGALVASTDKSPHRAYLRVNSDLAQDWLSATDGDQLLVSSECTPVSTARIRYALDGYAVGDGAVYEYPIRLWYRDVAIMGRRDAAIERNQICHATTERIKEKRQGRQANAWKMQEEAVQALIDSGDWSMERRAEMRDEERKARKLRDEAKLTKKARRTLNAAKRTAERKECEERVRSLNEQAAERRSAATARAAAAAATTATDRRARLAKLHRAKAKVAFRVWDIVSGPYRARAKLAREEEKQRAAEVLASKREQAEKALIADTEERRLARLEREEAELAEWAGVSAPKLKQRNKQAGLDRTVKTVEEQAKWDEARRAIKEKNRIIQEEKRLEAERRRVEAAATRRKYRPLMEVGDWALDEPRVSRRPVDDDERSVCSVASSAITTTTTTSLPAEVSMHALKRGRERAVRKRHLQHAKKNATPEQGENGNWIYRGEYATLVTDPTGQTAVTAWATCKE